MALSQMLSIVSIRPSLSLRPRPAGRRLGGSAARPSVSLSLAWHGSPRLASEAGRCVQPLVQPHHSGRQIEYLSSIVDLGELMFKWESVHVCGAAIESSGQARTDESGRRNLEGKPSLWAACWHLGGFWPNNFLHPRHWCHHG